MAREQKQIDPRFFTLRFLEANGDVLARAMRAHLGKWGAQGWRVIGRDPHLRLEVTVPTTVQRPQSPVRALRIGGRSIKPTVLASHAALRRERGASGEAPTAIGLARAIAPGARVRVGRGNLQEFVGIAAVLAFADGSTKILTCGHAQAFRYSNEILPSDDPDGAALATLDRNFLSDGDPVDAAICTLTDAGAAVLAASATAPTWKLKTVLTPSAHDNGKQSVFWQSHDGDDAAATSSIESFSGENSALFGPTGPQRGFVETDHAVSPGDSGSLLSLGTSLYAICSGFVGYTAFFTPIATVIARLKQEGTPCAVYRPSSD